MNADEIRKLPASMPLVVAAEAYGISRSKAYQLARYDPTQLPFLVLRLGRRYMVTRHALMAALSISELPSTVEPGTDTGKKFQITYSAVLRCRCGFTSSIEGPSDSVVRHATQQATTLHEKTDC